MNKNNLVAEIWRVTSQLAETYQNLKQQQWAYVTQTVNRIKKRLGRDSILRKEKGQWC